MWEQARAGDRTKDEDLGLADGGEQPAQDDRVDEQARRASDDKHQGLRRARAQGVSSVIVLEQSLFMQRHSIK